MKGTSQRFVIATIVVVALGSIATGAFLYYSQPTTGWEGCLLEARWSDVYAEVMRDGAQKPRPAHLRAVLAHACLATNRNNEALRWFLSLRRPEEVAAWTAWTEDFGRRHPREPVALYLLADAAARDGRLPEARKSLDRAIDREDSFAMAWSARGVIRLLEGDQDGALSDLRRATELAVDFSDAWSNLGAFWVTRSAAKGALEAYQEALQIDPYFALGYNGRGCAKVGSGEYQGAAEDFEVASRLFPQLIPAGANHAYALAFVSGGEAAWRERRPGMKLMTMSELESTNFEDLRSAKDMIQYGQSIAQLNDRKAALKILEKEIMKLTRRSEEVSAEIEQIRGGVPIANNLENGINNFVAWILPDSPVKGNQPDSSEAAKFLDQGSRGWLGKGAGGYSYEGEIRLQMKEQEKTRIEHYLRVVDTFRIPIDGRDPKNAISLHEVDRRQEVDQELPGANLSSIGAKPGGVTGRPAQASVVEGQWPVLTGFGLLYTMPKSPRRGEARP